MRFIAENCPRNPNRRSRLSCSGLLTVTRAAACDGEPGCCFSLCEKKSQTPKHVSRMTRIAIHFGETRRTGCEALTSSGLVWPAISSNVPLDYCSGCCFDIEQRDSIQTRWNSRSRISFSTHFKGTTVEILNIALRAASYPCVLALSSRPNLPAAHPL